MSRSEILRTLKKFKEKNAGKYGILQLGIFGSIARNEASESSDLDVVLKIKVPDPYLLVHIREEIENQLNMPVDIVRLRNKMNPLLKSQIEKDAVYV